MNSLIDKLVRGVKAYDSSLPAPQTKEKAKRFIQEALTEIIRKVVREELKKVIE